MPLYPVYPAPRLVYDVDGSSVLAVDSAGAITELSAGSVRALNDEGTGGVTMTNANSRIAVLFGELRDIAGVFISASAAGLAPKIEVSIDTTDGVNGSWSVVTPDPMLSSTAVSPNYRANVVTFAVTQTSVRGIRLTKTSSGSHTLTSFHLFGTTSTGVTPDMLALVSASGGSPLTPAALNFGDVARNQSIDVGFRIKNMSTTRYAQNVLVSLDYPTDASPSLGSQLTLLVGSTGGSVQNIGRLTPGGASALITLQYVASPTAQAGPWAFRVVATPSSWTVTP